MRTTLALSGVLVALGGSTLYADRGSIPFVPGVKIFEPNQRAMITWNGTEEILLLSTDLRASQATKVLEVLPLPGEPEVKKGDVEVFRKAAKLINEKLKRRAAPLARAEEAETARTAPGGEVTFHEKIGAHDVSVTHVLDRDRFIEWVLDYLRRAGVERPKIPEPLKQVVGEYLEDGFQWFVFDVVSLDERPRTNDAIQYRFKSRYLYYPLRITRAEEGRTSIDLLILTPRLLSRFPGIPIRDVRLRHEPIPLTADELLGLNQDMARLLGERHGTRLRVWRITGRLSSFKKDLLARE